METLRHLIRTILLESVIDPALAKAINSYVRDSRTVSAETHDLVARFVSSQYLPGIRLERIASTLPDWKAGDIVSLPLSSFTTKSVSTGAKAGHIAWKSYDEALIIVENATRGWKVDYDIITAMFDASDEAEVIVSGKYIVDRVEKIVEPGTLPQYDYRVPCFFLREA